MLTGSDVEFHRRLERHMNEIFTASVDKMAFHAQKETLDEWRGKLRMLRQIGELCKQIQKEMMAS